MVDKRKAEAEDVDRHLRQVLDDFSESAEIAEARAKSWGKKATLIEGRCWCIHEEDGTPLAVLVALTQPPPYLFTHVNKGRSLALALGVPLSIVSGNEPATNVPANKLGDLPGMWSPYAAPGGILVVEINL